MKDKKLVLVNCGKAPVSIFTPHNKPVTVPPGVGVKGDDAWLGRLIGTSGLTLLQQVPADFEVRGITEPMKEELIRDNRDPSHFRRPEASATPLNTGPTAVATKSSEAASKNQGTDTKSLSEGLPGGEDDGTPTVLGRSADMWRNTIRGWSDSTLNQQTKLQDLKLIAKLLDVDSADILSNKRDLIQAIRNKTH